MRCEAPPLVHSTKAQEPADRRRDRSGRPDGDVEQASDEPGPGVLPVRSTEQAVFYLIAAHIYRERRRYPLLFTSNRSTRPPARRARRTTVDATRPSTKGSA